MMTRRALAVLGCLLIAGCALSAPSSTQTAEPTFHSTAVATSTVVPPGTIHVLMEATITGDHEGSIRYRGGPQTDIERTFQKSWRFEFDASKADAHDTLVRTSMSVTALTSNSKAKVTCRITVDGVVADKRWQTGKHAYTMCEALEE